jgi:hypothetical protein
LIEWSDESGCGIEGFLLSESKLVFGPGGRVEWGLDPIHLYDSELSRGNEPLGDLLGARCAQGGPRFGIPTRWEKADRAYALHKEVLEEGFARLG